ncbi:MAG: hypothetical protein QXQ35_08560 [Candidatus Nezhaarchaeales archaeon]
MFKHCLLPYYCSTAKLQGCSIVGEELAEGTRVAEGLRGCEAASAP